MDQGKPTDSDSLLYPAYYRLKITRLRWLHAPDANYGSDYGNLSKRFNAGNTTGLANIGTQALEPMVVDGRALAASVTPSTVQPSLRGNAALEVKITSADGTTETLILPPVGD